VGVDAHLSNGLIAQRNAGTLSAKLQDHILEKIFEQRQGIWLIRII
jgi:hypothetical protein